MQARVKLSLRRSIAAPVHLQSIEPLPHVRAWTTYILVAVLPFNPTGGKRVPRSSQKIMHELCAWPKPQSKVSWRLAIRRRNTSPGCVMGGPQNANATAPNPPKQKIPRSRLITRCRVTG